MAFGITKKELAQWKKRVGQGELAYLTHYWFDPRFPQFKTVTKVGCSNLDTLRSWCRNNGLDPKYIHNRSPFPHFDLIGPKQKEILQRENLVEHLTRFSI